ncbi:hypothetical protein Tco_1233397, partial [Tanacetum coccineum]
MKAICNIDVPVDSKAPKLSSIAERVPQGTNPGAKPRHKKQSTSSKQPYVSSREATKGGSSRAPTGSKTGHSQKTSFILHSESGLGHDASADFTAEADPGISAPKDSISLTTG